MKYVRWIRYLLPLCLAGCGIDHHVDGGADVNVSGTVDTSGTQTIKIDIETQKTFLTAECQVLFEAKKKQDDCVTKVLADLDAFISGLTQ